MTLIIDSYAWVEFLTAGKAGAKVRELVESAHELVTPDIVLAELARVFARRGVPRQVIAGHLGSIVALSSVRPIDVEVALEAAKSDTDLRRSAQSQGLSPPSFADCLVLSFARRFGARVVTGDRHFEGLSETIWIGS